MRKYLLASIFVICAFVPAHSQEVVKAKIALGCVEKDVAKTVLAKLAEYVDLIQNKDKVQFMEDCEVFIEGDEVFVLERPKDEEFVKAQRPSKIKVLWLPASAFKGETDKK